MAEEKPDHHLSLHSDIQVGSSSTISNSLRHEASFFSKEESVAAPVELEKRFNLWSVLALEFSGMATAFCLWVTVGTSLDCGGPVGLIYGTVLVTVLNSLVALSMGELVSIMPKCGGQQLWAAKLPTAEWGPVCSYFTGYLNLIGEYAMSASCTFNSAQLTGACIAFTLGVEWTRWMTVLLFWGYLGVSLIVNFFPRYLGAFNVAGLIYLCAAFVACVAVFFAGNKTRQSAEFVFASFINNTGWGDVTSYILGLLPVAYSMTGYDAAAHMTEELEDPEVNCPKAMVGAVAIGGFSGLIFSIIMLFCIVDVPGLLDPASGQPYVQLFIDLFKSPVGGCLFSCVIGIPINMFAASSVTAASSRLAWAMACDGALPFKSYFSVLSDNRHVPVRTIILSAVCQGLFGTIYFGNEMAFLAILSIAVVALNLSYAIPIIIILIRGRGILDEIPLERETPTPGSERRFNLGWLGWPINFVSSIWPLFLSVMFLFPVYIPEHGLVRPMQANWSPAVLGLFLIVVTIYWFTHGKHSYSGPVTSQ